MMHDDEDVRLESALSLHASTSYAQLATVTPDGGQRGSLSRGPGGSGRPAATER